MGFYLRGLFCWGTQVEQRWFHVDTLTVAISFVHQVLEHVRMVFGHVETLARIVAEVIEERRIVHGALGSHPVLALGDEVGLEPALRIA